MEKQDKEYMMQYLNRLKEMARKDVNPFKKGTEFEKHITSVQDPVQKKIIKHFLQLIKIALSYNTEEWNAMVSTAFSTVKDTTNIPMSSGKTELSSPAQKDLEDLNKLMDF